MISLHAVVAVLLGDVPRGRHERVDDAGVDRRPVGGDLDRRRAVREGAGEERPRSTGIAALRDEDVDDLPLLIDRAVEVGPAPVTWSTSMPRSASNSSTSRYDKP
jgi:hypothetical protein